MDVFFRMKTKHKKKTPNFAHISKGPKRCQRQTSSRLVHIDNLELGIYRPGLSPAMLSIGLFQSLSDHSVNHMDNTISCINIFSYHIRALYLQ